MSGVADTVRSAARLYHGAALVVGTTGLLITGAPGSGKSALAIRLIESAAARGRFARLVSDDQVEIRLVGDRVVASAPKTIAGLIECRGSGVLKAPYLGRAVLHAALAPAEADGSERVPPDNEAFELHDGRSLLLVRLRYWSDREPLATLTSVLGRL